MSKSLALTLERFFPLKGRLVHEPGNALAIQEDIGSPLGAASFEESSVLEMPDLNDYAAMPKFAAPVDCRIGESLAKLRLIQVPQGSLLSASISHGVADGFGYFFFLMSWRQRTEAPHCPSPCTAAPRRSSARAP
jgi:hypothetical protein